MINIARQIYSGFNANYVFELPEAEIIPIGNSKIEKRKLELLGSKYTILKEHENIPLPGFTLFTSTRKSWGSLEKTWLIIDPRGFLVRISNENLESILHVTGITEGLIQEKCIWARDDSQTKMILVPTSSPKYIEAIKNTELIESKVDLTSVQIGDTVLLQNGLQGTYMGVISMYGMLNNYSVSVEFKPVVHLRKQVIEVIPGKYHYQTDLKILKVIKKTEVELLRKDSINKINEEIANNKAYFTSTTNMNSTYYSSYGKVNHVSINAAPKVLMHLEEITRIDANSLFYDAQLSGDFGLLMLENAKGKFLIDFPFDFSRSPCSINSFDICEIKNKSELSDSFEKIILTDFRKSLFSRTSLKTYDLSQFTKFYKIIKHVKNEIYT